MFMIRTCLIIYLIACILQYVAAFGIIVFRILLLIVETPYHRLKRQSNCVPCPANPPACPVCPRGQECQITSQSCTQCAQSLCIDSKSLSTLTGTGSNLATGPDTGAIAGGIVGAIIFVGCVAGGVFWYLRKRRQAAHDMDVWLDKTEANCDANEKEGRPTTATPSVHCLCQMLD